MKTLFLTIILALSIVSTNAQQINSVDKLTASYIGVKDALVSSNAELTKSRSKELLGALTAFPVKTLQPKQQKTYAAYLNKLKYDSRHISETTVIDHQREHFQSLSKNMFALLSGLNANNSPLYQQYCPMKKAYWLSESTEIRNPYYGEDMLECGKVTATLKVAAK
ncbi:DUF3347 domain-containing protein [Mucilaginibacter sp. ZT4R22]|uniref:DUF3347 domain-containing protein n=1 Tax=Mucilaginibacter pankratovii TaxID=2772110 RepID=A0ABR7WQV2_9SPHI|nr:DUF3347 domain-containing protein [Mucilaginibacter pankratovii]MBD1364695.1 DUF3347 domain-containing protein [Mucilaginibacter pankratovii]